MKIIKAFLNNPYKIFNILAMRGCFNKMDDEFYLKLRFRATMGYNLDLNNPKTFNEKLQWLKLYNRKPEYITMVDKYRVREYVASIIGEEYIVPLLGVWNSPDEINFETLPDQFVLKCNHNSGKGMYICKDKTQLDIANVKKKLHSGLAEDYYLLHREWPYKEVDRKIIAEEYLAESDSNTKNSTEGDLTDYKFYCFDGKPRFCQIISERGVNEKIDFFDMNWKHQDISRECNNSKVIPFSENTLLKPLNFKKMQEIASKLSMGIPFCRIDFYEVKEKLYFGEITFYPVGGFGRFKPKEWDDKLGDMIDLNKLC